jgi:hypothetical protein
MDVPKHSGSGRLCTTFEVQHTRPGTRNSFQRALCPLLLVGQCFALMPVSGLTGLDASTLRFRWRSPRVAYTILSLVGILFHLYYCLWDLFAMDRITYSACGKWCGFLTVICRVNLNSVTFVKFCLHIYGLFNNAVSISDYRASSFTEIDAMACVGVLISLWLFLFPIFLFAAQPKEFFLSGLKKLEKRSHKYVELRGEYVE